ncbi:MAG: N-6 DNA methylase, partial [Leptospiraceae bacterium]|nr:N-6 DNA methylase [Leptospiraceae bacterium]
MLPDVDSLKEISLLKLAELFAKETQELAMRSQTEEELKIGFEKLLEPLRNLLDIKFNPQYEKSIYTGRLDALHGQMIIEYERPSSFRSKQNLNYAFEQLVNYLYTQINQTKLTNFLGVGFDGEEIFFVRYQGNKEEIDRSEFVLQGPFPFDVNSAITFLIHLRALSRLPLNADNLALKFSPQSSLAPKFISALYNALDHWGSKAHIQTFFHEWLRLFGIVYGEEFQNNDKAKETQVLAKLYKITVQTKKGDQVFQKLLFCIHTFFAFLMKLITAELLTLRESSFHSSLVFELSNVSEKELKDRLEDIESGGVYRRRGITNFLEGDFFRWYLDAFDSPELREAIREMARTLSEFEVATNSLEPTFTRDLLKKLYQYLVPQEIRHKLGEYYTPDWLAELLLEEIEYDGNTNIRLLDPACGSGTFLVLAIQKAIEHGKKEKWPSLEIAKRIVANIWGFDLNPLAVIASRTNYLFTLGELASFLPRLELPIYLTDSVLTPTRTSRDLFGEYLEVSTSVGEFRIPAAWVNSSFLIAIAT